MSLSVEIARALERPETELVTGTVTTDSSGVLTVTRSGTPLRVIGWASGVHVAEGDSVLLALVVTPNAPAAVTVLARLSTVMPDDPDEGTVTAVNTTTRTCTAATQTVTLTGVRYVGAAPTVGAVVLLEYRRLGVYALGTTIAAPAPSLPNQGSGIAPPPSNESSAGTLTLAATGSGTWNASRGSWSSYYGTDVMQGSYGGQSYTGVWVYGNSPTQLAGRTITRAALTIGPMKRAGSYNTARVLHLHRTALTGMDGNPAPGGPTVDVTLPPIGDPWWSSDRRITSDTHPGLIALAQSLATSGGISATGNPYLGIQGVTAPDSGLLTIDWKA